MKNYKSILVALVALCTVSVSAQQVNTLYFLENAPMRHTINPAFRPVSRGYINFTPLGWYAVGSGNNSLTMSDLFMVDPKSGKTITALHPNADKQAFLKAFKSITLSNGELTLGFLNMGFQVKEKGFLTIGFNERISAGFMLPKAIPSFLLNGGMKDPNGVNNFDLSGLGTLATVYTEASIGYSYQVNEQWTVGGKLKILLGQAYIKMKTKDLAIDASAEEWHIHGGADLEYTAPFNMNYMNSYLDQKTMNQVIDGFKDGSFKTNNLIQASNLLSMATPSGYGAAIDFGLTYKPIENLQISAALVDLGIIYWLKGNRFKCTVDTVYEGVGNVDYGDPAYQDESGSFSTGILMDTVTSNLKGMLGGLKMSSNGNFGMTRMIAARLNVGVDANFWDNRIGVGVVSATRLYDARLYEELTVGVAFRPVNWFNIAASYSIFNNGKFSNIGVGLGLMPYDGINLTLVMDYLPTSYAAMPNTGMYVIPDKMKMFNLAMGFSICWASNRKDKDKDGVWNKLDMCPDTPRGVQVDERGCPLDEDFDGVPDYLDHCLGTPSAAIGFVDTLGCELDMDGDGVEDYRDKCPYTPEGAWGKVDTLGCPLDTDGDGVEDYLDACPDTPKEAYGRINKKGCPLDTDGDGVPDYIDACPGTPREAWGKVDENGCPLDRDDDGVPDYLDECPNTSILALGYVDAKGCELDSDNDGIPDYKDECPLIAGPANNKGCPEMKREVRQLLQKAMQGIEFEAGKATIKKTSYDLLDRIAETFVENEHYLIEVQGHTDNVGKPDLNQKISEQRAQAVKEYLEKKGVAPERLTAVGYGSSVPVADNDTKEGRQKNRRVEFNITFEEVHVETVLDHADPTPKE